jgi:hypothetical protein
MPIVKKIRKLRWIAVFFGVYFNFKFDFRFECGFVFDILF